MRRCDRRKRWRDFCRFVIDWKWFDRGVLMAIAISSIALAIDRPEIGNGSPERYVLRTLELVLNGVFLAEAVLKIGATGFLKYIRLGWNKLDFFIVCTSVRASFSLDSRPLWLVIGDYDASSPDTLAISPCMCRCWIPCSPRRSRRTSTRATARFPGFTNQ